MKEFEISYETFLIEKEVEKKLLQRGFATVYLTIFYKDKYEKVPYSKFIREEFEVRNLSELRYKINKLIKFVKEINKDFICNVIVV